MLDHRVFIVCILGQMLKFRGSGPENRVKRYSNPGSASVLSGSEGSLDSSKDLTVVWATCRPNSRGFANNQLTG